ncbi:hypothetical protein BJY59DRAFT_305590 [Rhodotorula toruloides]
MAPASSASSSDGDEKVQYLATSLSGLPVRVPGQQDGLENGKGEPKGLKDTLDLATNSQNPADVAAKLEQKRLEHEKQRAAQKKAFEEQALCIFHMHSRRLASPCVDFCLAVTSVPYARLDPFLPSPRTLRFSTSP